MPRASEEGLRALRASGCWTQERVDWCAGHGGYTDACHGQQPSLTLPERLLTVVTVCSPGSSQFPKHFQSISFDSPHIPVGEAGQEIVFCFKIKRGLRESYLPTLILLVSGGTRTHIQELWFQEV